MRKLIKLFFFASAGLALIAIVAPIRAATYDVSARRWIQDGSGSDRAYASSLLRTPALLVPLADRSWANTGTDFNVAASWVENAVPGAGDRAVFATAVVTQPNLSASASILNLAFSTATSSGYTLTSSDSSIALTLLSTLATAGNRAIDATNTTGTNTINAPLILGGAAASTQGFSQTRGGTLILNGVISSTNAITGLSFANVTGTGNATFTLNAANTYSGNTLNLNANLLLNLNNAQAISTGALVASGAGLNIDNTSGAAITMTNNNNITLSGGSLVFTGTNNLSFGSGIVTMSVANRTITVNGGMLSVGGIAESGGTRSFTKAGVGTLAITGASTYTGNTTISGGTLFVANSLGAGNVSLTAANVTLTLQGTGNNYISDSGNLSIGFTNDTVNLNFSGSDTIGSLTVAGAQQSPGVYGAVGSGAQFELAQLMGTGTFTVLTVIPEPATYMLLGFGVLVCAQRFRRNKN